jgi:hypothetical protein
MKKIYIFAISVFTINQIQAQLTLTKSFNEPVIGEFYDSKTIDTTSTLPMSIIGVGSTWNVTGITESGAINTNTISAPSAYPGSSTTFPGVTMIQEDLTFNNLSYFKSTPTTLELVGAYTNVGVANAELNYNSNSAILLSYPVAMGYLNNDLGAGTISTSTLSGVFTSTIQTVADGSGTLIFNGAVSLTNCLRVKIKQNIAFNFLAGSLVGTVDQIGYNYYHSSSKFPVFTVAYSHIVSPGFSFAGIPPINTRQAKVETLSGVAIGIFESYLNEITFKAFPNPAKNELNIHFVITQSENFNVEITNCLGQVVKSISLSNLTPGLYNEFINISGLNSGIYSITVKGKNALGTQKLIIE